MTVVEHLEELRTRLVISLAAIAVASVVGFVFFDQIFDILLRPYRLALAQLPAGTRPPGSLAGKLIYSSPIDPFLTRLKIGFFSGLMLALPVVLYELWRFITPGLTKRERRLGIPFVLSSVLLFAGGVAFAYFTIPRGLSFLLSLGSDSLVPLLTVDRYINFLIFLTLGFGLSFEFPLVMIFLAAARVISTAQMRKWRRFVYFGALVFAAVITPTQDPYTMLLMWIPLTLLYEGAILVARLFKR
ncbi:MAG: twin-arginine translocase subunit TatC [Actinomycetota bacterium]|nr:twin-arginine translocase subunit TatC [Actinomycetota bacterium]